MTSGRRTRAPQRVRRTAAFAATSATLATLAHVVGGGSLPNGWLLGLGALIVAAAAWPCLRREAGWPQITAGLAAAQVGLHGWLSLTGLQHGTHSASGSAGRMLSAHIVATVVAVIWLRIGEQGIWRSARLAWVRSLLAHTDRAFTLPPLWAPPAIAHPAPPMLARYFAACLGVRGPPLPVRP